MPIISGAACYCSKFFSSSVHLLTFYPSSMPLDVGDLQNHKCPCWLSVCVFIVHIVDFHTPFLKAFPQTKPRVCEGKRKQPKSPTWSEASLKRFLKDEPSYPSTQRKKAPSSFSPPAPLEEGLVPGSSPSSWTWLPRHGLWHQGADTVRASLTRRIFLLNPHLLGPIGFLFLSKGHCQDSLCGDKPQSGSVDCEGVMHMQHCTM